MTSTALRRTVVAVALLNLAYFGVEFTVARAIGSVSLFADSVDFLEDASVNTLIAVALGWPPRRRAALGTLLALVLLVPGIATVVTAWQKLQLPLAPDPVLLGATGVGALVVNVGCALLLARFRAHAGSLSRAAFLSARNDAFANVAIVVAGALTAFVGNAWPDLVVGIGIAILNADSARDVWRAARDERRSAAP
jgi:Co/Zn/Cd efflux system component